MNKFWFMWLGYVLLIIVMNCILMETTVERDNNKKIKPFKATKAQKTIFLNTVISVIVGAALLAIFGRFN